MRQPLTYITIIFILCFDCCRSKSNSFSSSGKPANEKTGNDYAAMTRQVADSLIKRFASEKKYDSLDALIRSFISKETGSGGTVQAVELAVSAYSKLDSGSSLKKNLALFLFEKKDSFKKDTIALKLLYNFFTSNYVYDYGTHAYDPQYTGIAEYFISLQKEYPWLSADDLISFKEFLGIGYNVAGDLKKAIVYYRETLEYDIRTSPEYIGGSASNLCIALMESGLYDSVINFTNRLLKTYSFSDNHLALLHILIAEAYLYNGNLRMAVQSVSIANASLLKITVSEDRIKRTFELEDIRSQVQYALGNYQQSLTYSKNALNSGLKYTGAYRNRFIGKTLLLTGAIYKKLNLPDSAAWYFHQSLYTVANVDSAITGSLPNVSDVYAENTIMDALDSLALLWDEQYLLTKNTGFYKKALQARQLAFVAERKLLEAFTYDDAMHAQLLQSKKRSALAIQNCYTLWQQDKDKKWIQQSIFIAENSKAIILLHSVQRNKIDNNIRETDTMVKGLNSIRHQVIMLERKLNQTTEVKSRDSLSVELVALNNKYLETESRLNQKYPSYKRTGVDTSLITLQSLHKKIIRKKSCMIQYFVNDSGAFIIWLDDKMKGGMEFLPESVFKWVDSFSYQCRLKRGLYDSDRSAFFALSSSCTQKIIPESLRQYINSGNCRKMVVIPDGIFSTVPFESLTLSSNEFLLNKCTIYTGYSLSTLFSNEAGEGKDGGVAVFTPFSKQGFHQKARLPFTKDEGDKIKKAYKAAYIEDDTAATIQHFRNSLSHDKIIHIASHATISPEEEPRIFFSDSILYMSELYAAYTNASLVVLSGCETGLGKLNPNEGPLSLSRAFYYAGAKNVINSLWRIDDAATATLFGDFYKNYAVGNTGIALRKAKLEFLIQQHNRSTAPYYWAGLIHMGLDKEEGQIKSGINNVTAILIAILLTALLLYFRIRKQKQQYH